MRIPIQSLWFFGWFFSWRFRMSCILVNLWRIFVFCELEFGIWNAHCHKLLQSFLQMILSRGDNSTDLCYTLNTYDGSTWAQTQKPLDLCLMPQPLIFPTQNYARKTLECEIFPVCSVGISCMYHHYMGKVPKPLMQVVVAASWELLGYAGPVAWSWEFCGLKKPKKKPQ